MAGYYPEGVSQTDIDRAAGGYDPPECECVYDAATDTQDSEDCPLHCPGGIEGGGGNRCHCSRTDGLRALVGQFAIAHPGTCVSGLFCPVVV